VKILTVVTDLGPGGTQRVAQNCAVGYRQRGVESAVLAYEGGGCRVDNLREMGVEIFVGGEELGERRSGLAESIKWNPDIVHIHRTGYPDGRSGEILASLAAPHRKIIETNVFARFDPTPEAKLIDVHVVLSHWCLWKYQMWAGNQNPQPLAVVVPNPVDITRFYPLSPVERLESRAQLGLPKNAFVFGRIGQPHPAKWSLSMINAFEKVARRHDDVFLALVGVPRAYERHIEKANARIGNRIRLLPFMHGDERLRRCYGAFDSFLHVADIGESFGMVLCEAMLCGVPVITLATPCKDNSQAEVVGHEIGGLVVRHRKRLPEAMEVLIDDNELRERISSQAPSWVASRFDLTNVVADLIDLSAALLESDGRKSLERRIVDELGLRVNADWASLAKQSSRGLGAQPAIENWLRVAVHLPWFYAAWQMVKRRNRR